MVVISQESELRSIYKKMVKSTFSLRLFVVSALLLVLSLCSCRTQTIQYGDPKQSETAILFYPGGKVNPYAYSDMFDKISDDGIAVIVAKMPFNLAVFGKNAANPIIKKYPEVKHWFIGGHSLGGVMASSWSAKHEKVVDGVILLASYPIKELTMPVLSIYGSEDGVLRMEKYHEGMERIADLQEHVIFGGNHCQFGDYGFQNGDNRALISPQEQIEITVGLIEDFIERIIFKELE